MRINSFLAGLLFLSSTTVSAAIPWPQFDLTRGWVVEDNAYRSPATYRERTAVVAPRGSVDLNRVRVVKVVDDYTFFIVPSQSTGESSTPVVLLGEVRNTWPEHKVDVRRGDVLSIEGRYRPTNEMVNRLKLSSREREEFLSHPVVINATKVKTHSRAE